MLAEDVGWGLSEQLLATIADQLAAANWQRGGGKGQRPRPIERPGVVTKTRFGGDKVMSLAEVREWSQRNQEGTE